MGIRYRIAERALVSAFDIDESNRKAFVCFDGAVVLAEAL